VRENDERLGRSQKSVKQTAATAENSYGVEAYKGPPRADEALNKDSQPFSFVPVLASKTLVTQLLITVTRIRLNRRTC